MTECGANNGGYYVGFYEKTDHDNGLGGFLFMLEVFPTDYDYTELPEYQAICGLTVDGANYNLIAELPTDVQFANEKRISTAACPTIFRPSSRALRSPRVSRARRSPRRCRSLRATREQMMKTPSPGRETVFFAFWRGFAVRHTYFAEKRENFVMCEVLMQGLTCVTKRRPFRRAGCRDYPTRCPETD